MSFLCSQELDAVHDNENKDHYTYKLGVCTDVDDDHPGCAVMQYEKNGGGRAFCAGKVSTAQIARSEYIVIVNEVSIAPSSPLQVMMAIG